MLEPLKPYLRPFYVPVANAYYFLFKRPRRYRYLFDAIREVKAKKILEVGTWNGDRAVKMIALARSLSPDPIEYYGFDLFELLTDEQYEQEISKHPPTQAEVEHTLAQTGATVRLIKGNTRDTLPREVVALPKMDFIFIDGGHHVDTIKNDWECCAQLMHERTIVIFDDYWRNRPDEGCKPIIDAIDKSIYEVQVLPIIDSFDTAEFGRLDINFARVQLRKSV